MTKCPPFFLVSFAGEVIARLFFLGTPSNLETSVDSFPSPIQTEDPSFEGFGARGSLN